jgi:tetratricopeptide (TPR) repeat protein
VPFGGIVKQAYASLNDAITVAENIHDQRTASYAYGYLGKLYEDERQYADALELSREAVFAAQQKNATEALYKWHWQCGRILGKMEKRLNALFRYASRTSIHTLALHLVSQH